MFLECYENIAFQPDAKRDVEAFFAHVLRWHEKLNGTRLMIEYDQPIFRGKNAMAFSGTSMKINSDGDAQITGIKSLLISGE